MKMDSETKPDSPVRPHLFVLHYLHRIVVFFGRIFFTLVYGTSKGKVPAITNPLLLESASSLAEKIRNRKITSEELVDAFIARIEEINPVLNCVVEKNFDQARSLAKEADKVARENSPEKLAKDKPLLGVPFTTKDCIAVEGLHNTAGLVLRRDVIAEQDAVCVGLARAAGAIPLGLTNVSEFCMWWESHNYVHGRTNNPYDTTRIVGGSSGGEGCNQAAAGSAFGIGSDIGGSIRMPCFFNGIFGHKPSKFIVSNVGQFPQPDYPLQSSFLGLGPMCRKACDLKPLLRILAGENASKLNLDKPVQMKALKVYYQLDNLGSPLVCPVDPEIKQVLMKVVNHLSSTFDLQPEEKKIKRFYKSNPIWLTTMKGGDESFIKRISGHDGYFYALKELAKNLFGRSGHTMIALFTGLFEKTGAQPGDEKHTRFLKVREELEKEVKDMLGENGILIYPTHPTPAPYHDEPVIRPLNFSYTAIINCLGLPATHIPMGLHSKEGLPIGIQVIGNTNNDRICLAVAEELDKAFGGWIQP